MTAGTLPAALSFRTAERPVAVRRSAVSFACLAMFQFSFAVVVDLEQRRNRFVVMDSFHAFAEKLGDAKHGGLKSFHGANGRAVRGY
jgi:hypothetical protein